MKRTPQKCWSWYLVKDQVVANVRQSEIMVALVLVGSSSFRSFGRSLSRWCSCYSKPRPRPRARQGPRRGVVRQVQRRETKTSRHQLLNSKPDSPALSVRAASTVGSRSSSKAINIISLSGDVRVWRWTGNWRRAALLARVPLYSFASTHSNVISDSSTFGEIFSMVRCIWWRMGVFFNAVDQGFLWRFKW